MHRLKHAIDVLLCRFQLPKQSILESLATQHPVIRTLQDAIRRERSEAARLMRSEHHGNFSVQFPKKAVVGRDQFIVLQHHNGTQHDCVASLDEGYRYRRSDCFSHKPIEEEITVDERIAHTSFFVFCMEHEHGHAHHPCSLITKRMQAAFAQCVSLTSRGPLTETTRTQCLQTIAAAIPDAVPANDTINRQRCAAFRTLLREDVGVEEERDAHTLLDQARGADERRSSAHALGRVQALREQGFDCGAKDAEMFVLASLALLDYELRRMIAAVIRSGEAALHGYKTAFVESAGHLPRAVSQLITFS